MQLFVQYEKLIDQFIGFGIAEVIRRNGFHRYVARCFKDIVEGGRDGSLLLPAGVT